MTFPVKNNILIVLLSFLITPHVDLYSFDNDLSMIEDPFDDDLVEQRDPTCPVPPADIASLLVSLDIVSLLKEPLYLKTYPLNERSLLTLPIFLPQGQPACGWTIGSHFFWNQTAAMFFTRKSSALCSYMGINEPTLLDKLSQITILQELGLSVKPENILPLFAPLKINERRFGFMLHAQHQWERTRFRITTPLYYLERNVFLTTEEKNAVEQALGQTTDEEQMDFAKKHLISDRLGFGDTRLVLDYNLTPDSISNSAIGLFTTVPTAYSFATGLLGSSFNCLCKPPILDFVSLFNLIVCDSAAGIEQAKKIAENFGLGALDRFASILLSRPLGDDGHGSLGVQFTSETPLRIFVKRPWAENVIFKSRVSLEYFFPATEKRFFIQSTNAPGFKALGLDRPKEQIIAEIMANQAYALQVIAFLEKELTEKFYPFHFNAKVFPGLEFQWTSRATYEAKKWGLILGTDTWVRTPERITHIDKTRSSPENISISRAQRPFAYQWKVLSGLFYKIERKDKDIRLSLNADNTVFSAGIGKDFTVSLNLECNF